MKLNLKKPLVFFDLETTGLNVVRDKIVQLGAIKVFPDGSNENYEQLINPGIPIPPEVSKIHKIFDEDVKDKPLFVDIANELNEFLNGCDLAGYNSNKFDIPLLAEEFSNANIFFSMEDRVAVDIQNIFHKMEKRTLEAAYKFYCDKNLENAHSATADVMATYEILFAQLNKYQEELKNDISFLSEFSTRGDKPVDMAGFIVYNKNGIPSFSFGKYKGKTLKEVYNENPGYFSWISNAEFPFYTKKVLKDAVTKFKDESRSNSNAQK